MLVVIDNYDSFTYNLVQYIGETEKKVLVFKNDKITIDEIKKIRPSKIVISPGPSWPENAGISKSVILEFMKDVPILGVCLGHQCIAEALGGKIKRNFRIMHGKVSAIYHNGMDIYRNVKNPFNATRYHSLVVDKKTLPHELVINAWTRQGEIMGLKHKKYPLFGVQFHPESILTEEGKKIIRNFIKL
ncbi:MAG: aminodeoxychorismate/anthranilate synthase component II [Candidatus Goldbacteria bacterium]|nr:aminodeoxychorismate/anthranilate synthase component II [Candidatus Goldiibacteriota bacterium]